MTQFISRNRDIIVLVAASVFAIAAIAFSAWVKYEVNSQRFPESIWWTRFF